jgi:hypothetical protein
MTSDANQLQMLVSTVHVCKKQKQIANGTTLVYPYLPNTDSLAEIVMPGYSFLTISKPQEPCSQGRHGWLTRLDDKDDMPTKHDPHDTAAGPWKP